MSTIDIGITDIPMPAQATAPAMPAAHPAAAPAPVADDDFFYVGSVKIEPTAPSHPAATAVKAWSR